MTTTNMNMDSEHTDITRTGENLGPRVETSSPSPFRDLDRDDDPMCTNVLFASTPQQQEPRTNRNRSKRHVPEVSGGDDSPRGTPPSDNSPRHMAKDPLLGGGQVLSMPFTPLCVSKALSKIVELSRGLRALAELMQQVVTNNDAKYQEVIGALHKVAFTLRETREGAAETSSKARVHRKPTIPLELKVNF
jgi:hypothetical protein